jgi:hypothetical protein
MKAAGLAHCRAVSSAEDDVRPHISPPDKAVAISSSARYWAVTCGLRVRRFAIGREVHVADLGSVFIGCRGSGPGFGLRSGPWEVAMTTTPIVAGGELVPVADPLFSVGERAALAGFLTGYSGLTREAYTLDLRQ